MACLLPVSLSFFDYVAISLADCTRLLGCDGVRARSVTLENHLETADEEEREDWGRIGHVHGDFVGLGGIAVFPSPR
jgi:hypothetical protein